MKRPAALGVASGQVELSSTFDASKQPSRVHIDARFRQLEINRLFGKSKFAEKSTGPLAGRIALSGTGESVRELMATAIAAAQRHVASIKNGSHWFSREASQIRDLHGTRASRRAGL